MTEKKDPVLERAYAVGGPDAVRDLYRDWAADYDHDTVGRLGYVAPRIAVDVFADHLAGREAPIIDVGCGTGLAGVALRTRGFRHVDGLDLSPDMLAEARTKTHAEGPVYDALIEGDLTARLPVDDDAYAGAVSVGTFTHGHVGPAGLGEVLRIVRPGGLVTVTVNDGVYDAEGYDAALAALAAAGRATVVDTRRADYLVKEGIGARVVTLAVAA
ncbi:class I SAM-dependent DNA methyltransferase [Roseospira goensis]|uniref:Putative TPR repeat methyltransferase n=1 Tax=Roseospira goensis TaxID=391922 RepID=A0A7W6RZI7_9PROT|nr:class I SAM-dependent methyltransferase [Roseospira goensis]MBB4285941.1 putative TPR repeat methyltransferase [Roseospira goensis]